MQARIDALMEQRRELVGANDQHDQEIEQEHLKTKKIEINLASVKIEIIKNQKELDRVEREEEEQ